MKPKTQYEFQILTADDAQTLESSIENQERMGWKINGGVEENLLDKDHSRYYAKMRRVVRCA